MENRIKCPNCEIVSTNWHSGECPICGHDHPIRRVVSMPSTKEDAIKDRDAFTWLVVLIADGSGLGDDWRDVEFRLYHEYKEKAEEMDDYIGRKWGKGD